jgi:hypothetical protein
MGDLTTLNALRLYLAEITPINHGALFQRLELYSSTPSLPIRSPSREPPQVQESPVNRTRSPVQEKPVYDFDISRVSMERGSYTVPELKWVAKELGLPTTGRKIDLVNRILQAWNGTGKTSAR